MFDRFVRQQRGEDRRAVRREAQERFDLRPAERLDLAHRQERIESRLGIAQYRHVASDQKRARVLAGAQARDLGRVLAPIGSAVEPIDGDSPGLRESAKADLLQRPEPGLAWAETQLERSGAVAQR